MPSLQRSIVFAAVVTAFLISSSASWGWFWNKTNTIKAYETCLSENLSRFVEAQIIRKKCVEKLAGPIPSDKITARKLGGEGDPFLFVAPPFAFPATSIFSAKDYLLTSVSAVAVIDGARELPFTVEADVPVSTLAFSDAPDRKTIDEIQRSYGNCYRSQENCITLRVIRAKGFEITVE